jgi:carbon storage regulator CsrA
MENIMLALTRKESESITIGNDIEVKILRSDKIIRIGITVPQDTNIVRTELLARQQ